MRMDGGKCKMFIFIGFMEYKWQLFVDRELVEWIKDWEEFYKYMVEEEFRI